MTASGAVKHGDDLYCRKCGRMCDMNDGNLWCDNGCFVEEYECP